MTASLSSRHLLNISGGKHSMRRLIFPLCLSVASCTSSTAPYEVPTRAFSPTSPQQQPVTQAFLSGQFKVLRSNRSIARDILQLTFFLENGKSLDTLTRFEGPISVRVLGDAPQSMHRDLNALLTRIREKAGIDISHTGQADANITLQLIPRSQIKKLVPNAACFVAPNVSGLRDYLENRSSVNSAWSRLERRTKMSIFLPSDASPQEIRDCIHEEMTQALGPVNDLYSLTDSVFNDDNVHATLTDFDLLVLRTLYDPTLRTGMSRGEVAASLSLILSRLNPIGDTLQGSTRAEISPKWNELISIALGAGASAPERIRAAERAVVVAKKSNFHDVRLGFSYFVLGRVSIGQNPSASRIAFDQSNAAYAKYKGTELHRAFVASQLAAFALSAGNSAETIAIVKPYIPVARQYENYALLSTLQLLQAEALELAGRSSEARSVRLDSMASARYGFGSETAVQARLREIASLSPR